MTILSNNITDESYIVCGYHPYTHYNFSVDCFPGGVYAGYFSDPVFMDVWTPMAEPELGPRATNGSFTSTSCTDGIRNVTLMWQEVDTAAQNGNITGYIIRLGQDDLTATQASVFSATVVVSCDPVSVAVFAFNNAGWSISPTILLISTTTVSTVVENSFIVEIKSPKTLLASWEEGDKVRGEVTYTIFWCEGRLEQSCQGEIQWLEVPAGHTEFAIPVDSSQASQNIYGISARNVETGVASQLFWASCLFRRYPTQPPVISHMDVKGLEGGVYITWAADRCNYVDQVRYTSFELKWCQTSECDVTSQIYNTTVGVGESTYTVTSLLAGVNYSFTVQPMSYETPGREVQPWKTAVPSAKDQADDPVSLGAVFGGLASAVAVLLLFILVCRVCRQRRKKIKGLEDNLNLHLPNGVAQEFGSDLNERMLEGSCDQPTCLEFINEGSSIRSSDASESGIRPGSTNGYCKFTRGVREVCNNVQDPESEQSEKDSEPKEQDYMQQPENDSAPKEQGYMQQPGNDSAPKQQGYMQQPGNDSAPKERGYMQQPGNDLALKERGYMQQPGNDSAPKEQGYMQQPREQPSDTSPHVIAAPNGYCRLAGHESTSEVCSDLQARESKQSEQDSATESGIMLHPSHTECSDEEPHSKPSSESYSRVIGDGVDSCNIEHDPESGQSELTSTEAGYMPHPSTQSSGKASNKGSVFISGTSALPSVFTMAPSNISMLRVNAIFGKYSDEEETHASELPMLKPTYFAVDSTAGEISQDTLELGHSRGSALLDDGERSKLSDHRTTETVAERLELDFHSTTEIAGDKFGLDYRGPAEIGDVYRSVETADESIGLGNFHRTTETDPGRHASVSSMALRAGSHSATSDTSEVRTTAPVDVNQRQEISANQSDADISIFEQNFRSFISQGRPENGSALSTSSHERSDRGEDSGTTPSSLEYIQLTQFNCSDSDSYSTMHC